MLKTSSKKYLSLLYNDKGLDRCDYYEVLYNRAFPYFKKRKFNYENVVAFVEILRQTPTKKGTLPSISYINNLVKALKWLARFEGVDFMEGWKLKKCPKPYIPIIEEPDMRKLLEYAYKLSYRRALALEFYFYSGLRASELIKLKWSDIHDIEVFIENSKTDKSRSVCVVKDLLMKLQSLRSNHPVYVFSTSHGFLNRCRLNQFLKTCYEGIGFKEHLALHRLRHSFATMADDKGLSMRMIQHLLGHSSIQTTQHYIHITHAKMVKAAKQVYAGNCALTEEEIREECNALIHKLNMGKCQAYQVPQNHNIVINVPLYS